VAKDFELFLRQARNMEEEDLLISVGIISWKKLNGLRLVIDGRE